MNKFSELLFTCIYIVDARDRKQQTSLHLAALIGSVDVVKLLLDAGADALAQDGNGMTPLHLSVTA